MIPSGIARTVATIVAMNASCSDSAKRSLISSVIGPPVHMDIPRSRRITPQVQIKNCFQTGLSRPSLARSAAIAAAETPCPSPDMNLTWTTSPGMTRRRRKMIAATPSSVGNIRRNRLRMYRPMCGASPCRGSPLPPRWGQGSTHPLLREPDRIELIVQIVARCDLPPVHFARVRNDPMPLERHDVVHFLVQRALFDLAHVLLSLLDIVSTALLGVEVVEHLVVVEAVVRRVPASRGELVEVEVRLDDVPALEVHRDLEVTLLQGVVVRGRFDDLLLDRDANLSPLIDQPHGDRLVRHRYAAVLEREREPLRAG